MVWESAGSIAGQRDLIAAYRGKLEGGGAGCRVQCQLPSPKAGLLGQGSHHKVVDSDCTHA